MYHHLRGKILELSPTSAVIDVGGIGYDLRIPLSTYESLKGSPEASVYTHLHVREDELKLFGFATSGERDLFRVLISVNGIGPSTAIAALCALSPADVARAIASGDSKTLQKIKGVGRKIAERLSVELKDRMGEVLLALGAEREELSGDGSRPAGGRRPAVAAGRPWAPDGTVRAPEALDAISALVGLGYDRKGAEARVDAACEALRARLGPGQKLDLESLFKESLRGG